MSSINSMIFRPQSTPKKWTMRGRRDGTYQNYNLRKRGTGKTFFEWNNEPLNHCVLGRIMIRLHYLSEHSPDTVNKQWRNAERLFYRAHYGVGKQSARYANTWTMHSWT